VLFLFIRKNVTMSKFLWRWWRYRLRVWFIVLLCAVGVALFLMYARSTPEEIEVVLLEWLEITETQKDTSNEYSQSSWDASASSAASLQVTSAKTYTDIWKVDTWSRIYRSIGKQWWSEGHDGSIDATWLLFTADDEAWNLFIVTGRSHITFLMSSFDVANIPNDWIRTLFLNHLHSDDFLDVDVYPFAQFVVDEVIEDHAWIASGNLLSMDTVRWTIHGRLKLKDVVETVSLQEVSIDRQWDGSLFVRGTLELSRYLWWLDGMPWVIDEFVVIQFELWFSKI
jgi:polyisoprenoid-binding protein YceI